MPFKVLHLTHDELKKHKSFSRCVIDLYKVSFSKQMFNNSSALSDDKFLDECLSYFESCDIVWWMLLVDDELVSVVITALFLKEYFIYNLCTHPKYRMNGYAKYLLFEIKSHAIDNSIIGFKGNVDLDNIGAIRFYTKYGAYKDQNFSKSDKENPPTFMRLLYRWDNTNRDDLLQQIKEQQNSVLKRFKWQRDRPNRIKKAIMITISVSIGYLFYKNYNFTLKT